MLEKTDEADEIGDRPGGSRDRGFGGSRRPAMEPPGRPEGRRPRAPRVAVSTDRGLTVRVCSGRDRRAPWPLVRLIAPSAGPADTPEFAGLVRDGARLGDRREPRGPEGDLAGGESWPNHPGGRPRWERGRSLPGTGPDRGRVPRPRMTAVQPRIRCAGLESRSGRPGPRGNPRCARRCRRTEARNVTVGSDGRVVE
jgi:hypothetical protein